MLLLKLATNPVNYNNRQDNRYLLLSYRFYLVSTFRIGVGSTPILTYENGGVYTY
jgi:hypothetical protein